MGRRWFVTLLACVVSCGSEEAPCEGDQCAEVTACDDEGVCPGTARWSRALEVNVQGDATIAPDGRIFLTAGISDGQTHVEPHLLAFESDGTFVFDEMLADYGLFGWPSRPVYSADGIFVAAGDRLYRYDLDGRASYHAIAPEGSMSGVNLLLIAPPPAVDVGNRIYWQFLAATNQDGTLQWRTFVDPETRCESPVAARTDRVLVRVGDTLTAYDHTGSVAWSVTRPNELRGDPGCQMIPIDKDVVSTVWCSEGYDVFRCGHEVLIDIEDGTVLSHTPPPAEVPLTSSVIVDRDGSRVFFSIGPDGNPDYKSRMWRLSADGEVLSDAIKLPFFGVFGVALGDDGLFYVSTENGAAAIDGSGEVRWRYEPYELAGRNAGAPAIGDNGCVYYEEVTQQARFKFERHLVCLESTARGLADTKWPRTSGDNYSALRIH